MPHNFNPVQSFQTARKNQLGIEAAELGIAESKRQAPVRNELAQLNLQQARSGVSRGTTQFDQEQALQRGKIVNQVQRALLNVPEPQRRSAVSALIPELTAFDINLEGLTDQQLSDEGLKNGILSTEALLSDPSVFTAGEREFRSLVKAADLDKEGVKSAARRKLGLEAREISAADKIVVIGGVPHVFDPDTQTMKPVRVSGKEVTTKTVGESKAKIAGRVEQAKKQAGISAKFVERSFDSIQKVEKNILNLDRAADALRSGAGTGPIEQFFPSFKSASRQLQQIQRELGLDVIGSVTFGALSKGELDLALETALDLGQDEDALLSQIVAKKVAQEKLIGFYRQAVSFLSGNNEDGSARTVAQFMETGGQQGQTLVFDPATGQLVPK